MARWEWLTRPEHPYTKRFVARVLVKAAILFIAFNAVYALTDPLPWLSQITLYNTVVPGRERLPFAENPGEAYSLPVPRLEGMFASHTISGDEPDSGEFRVALLGDSAVWGWLLEPDETLSACLNNGGYYTSDGRRLHVYNLGFPVLDVLKDVMILDEALRYEPDAVTWFITLAAFYPDEQLCHPIVKDNADHARDLIARYDLVLDASSLPPKPDIWGQTIIGQRRALADLLRHQIYGLAWAVTGIDHVNPKFDQKRPENLLPGDDVYGRPRVKGGWTVDNLSIDVLRAGLDMAAGHDVPVLLVNEPIFRSEGLNNEERYNAYYPRWAFDSFRDLMSGLAEQEGWRYLDLWNAMPNNQFTDTSLHLTPPATCELAAQVAPAILALAD
jgi:hypothetical protein